VKLQTELFGATSQNPARWDRRHAVQSWDFLAALRAEVAGAGVP